MKSTTNVFLDGLITDRHPLSTPQNCLTDALNATLLTYNGNEMMLQNDMGNTRIQDSATGNIMSLSPGFIPVGMKEHGGIMYIASVNKDGEGEIGTIPSPIIRDFYKDKQQIQFTDTELSVNSYVSISNKIYPSDKLIINLGLKVDPNSITGDICKKTNNGEEQLTDLSKSIDPCDYYIKRQCLQAADYKTTIDITSPIISYSPDVNSNLSYNSGIYKIKLASKSIANVSAEASDTLYNSYKNSNYWFLHENSISDIFPKDLFEATLNKDLKTFPTSSKPGYLQIKLEKEGIQEFGMLERAVSPHNTPYTVKLNDDEYEIYFPGFYYSTNSGIYVDNVQCSVLNELSGEYIPIITQSNPNGSTVANFNFKKNKLDSGPGKIEDVTGFDIDSKGIPILWNDDEGVGYPQWSVKDSNRFLLTNLCDVGDIRTRYKSTTVYDGMALLSYSGLFKIKLNKDSLNQWYRLQVVYNNEYEEQLGKSEYRFNPYLNDTFGSNVYINNISCSEPLQMGTEVEIPSSNWTVEKDLSFQYKADQPITTKMDNPWLNNATINGSYKDLVNSLYEKTSVLISAPQEIERMTQEEYCELPIYTYTGDNTFSIDLYSSNDAPDKKEIEDSINFQNVPYLYKMPNQKKSYSISYDAATLTFALDNKIDCHRFIYSIDEAFKVTPTTPWQHVFTGNTWTVVDIDGDDKTNNLYQSDSFRLRNSANSTQYVDLKADYIDWTTTKLYSMANRNNFQPKFPENGVSVDTEYLKNVFNLSLSAKPLDSDTIVQGEIQIGSIIDSSIKLLFTNLFQDEEYDPEDWWDTGEKYAAITYSIQAEAEGVDSSEVDEDVYLNFNLKVPTTSTFSIGKCTLKPLYQITPYFELRDKDKYVSKIHLTDDIFYECNLTLGENQEVYNYLIGTETGTTQEKLKNVFSYTTSEKYIEQTQSFIRKIALSEGVYVFNMSAPSTENLYSGFSAGVYPEVNITVGENNTTTVDPYKWAGSSQKYRKMKGYGISHCHFWPIVIIVPQTNEVTIEIPLDSEKQQSIRYQDIGIYKLNATDIFEHISFEKCAYLLPEYQLLITELAKQEFKDDQAKATEFKGNYCIFFRQAYSYIEGTYNKSEDVINQITVRGTKYPLAPFVPKEPYILNFMWDRTLDKAEEEDSSVNASALCGYCQPDAVLNYVDIPNLASRSVPILPPSIDQDHNIRKDQLFRFFPGGFSDNERPDDYVPQSHLTQQLLQVLDDTKIMCNPTENTLLIKSVQQ